MEMQKFTQQVQETIGEAQKLAVSLEHQAIDVLHVFQVLLQESDFAKRVYEVAEVDINLVKPNIEAALEKIPAVMGTNVKYGESMTNELYQLMIRAETEEKELEDEFISTEHLLLAVMEQRENAVTQSIMAQGKKQKKTS